MVVVSLFVTSEHGFMVQDNFAVDQLCSHIIALEIPHYYFIKKVTFLKLLVVMVVMLVAVTAVIE